MRPNVSEQLTGMRRVLHDVVAPDVTGSYPLDILDGVMSTLDALAASWLDVPAFLRWDAEETARLLQSRGIDTPAAPDDPLDLRALERWHADLRWLLERSVPTVNGPDLVAHLKERADRFPVRPETRMPGQR